MANLYLTEQGAVLRKTGDRLIVEKEGEVLLEVPCLKLDAVLVFGNVQFTTQAAVEMLDHGIELALLSTSGRLRGQLTPPKAKNVVLRIAQYDLHRSGELCLGLAREIVQAKIANSAAVLRRYRENHPEVLELAEIADLEAAGARAAEAESLESLLGLEGTAAARYFGLLGRLVPAELGFAGRNRRPPRDPLNALLSFGYVLVGNELQSLLDGMGYDPSIGFYHQVDYGRPSLALDLLEELPGAVGGPLQREALEPWRAGGPRLHLLAPGRGLPGPRGQEALLRGLRGRARGALHTRRRGDELPQAVPPPGRAPGPRAPGRRALPRLPLPMLITVSYDIRDNRRRTKVAEALENYGRRVQLSVFECLLEDQQVARLRRQLERLIEPQEDSVRIYRLCAECRGKVEVVGVGILTEDPDVYIV